MPETRDLLTVNELNAWYGESHVLHGVTFAVRPGEVVTLLGRNGVGKTTTLKAIMGILEKRSGSVEFEGKETDPASLRRDCAVGDRVLCRGARHLRQPRRQGEPAAAAAGARRAVSVSTASSRCFRTCVSGSQPRHQALRRRAADAGDRTHLAHRRAAVAARRTDRRLGAGHHAADRPYLDALKAEGFTILLVEQNFRFAATVADRYYVMEHGRIVDQFSAASSTPTPESCSSISEF